MDVILGLRCTYCLFCLLLHVQSPRGTVGLLKNLHVDISALGTSFNHEVCVSYLESIWVFYNRAYLFPCQSCSREKETAFGNMIHYIIAKSKEFFVTDTDL